MSSSPTLELASAHASSLRCDGRAEVSSKPDFGRRAVTYDELRPVDDDWREVCEALVREGDLAGRRVLDVGCGTGRFAAALTDRSRVWAVDPSPEMLEVARRGALGV